MEKTNEQLHQEFKDALKNLSEKAYNLLHYGNYQLEYVNRDSETQVVTSASMRAGDYLLFMRMNGEYKFLKDKGTEVTVTLPDNPIDQNILESWDKQTIDSELKYHTEKLQKLKERKEKLMNENHGKTDNS